MAFKYPPARRDETAIDEYHGVKVPDPYRWLEDPDAEETKAFVSQQNAISAPYLESSPIRGKLKERLTAMWDFPKFGCPFQEGDYYYYYHNSGLQNQSILYKQNSPLAEAEAFLDPNKLSAEGLVSIDFTKFSKDGKYMAYGLSESGSDWSKIQIKEVETGKDFPEVLTKVKFSTASWTHDHKGFFYATYPLADSRADGTETDFLQFHSLFYHRIGTDQSEDVCVVQFKKHPQWTVGGTVSHCGRYAIICGSEGCKNNQVFVCDLESLPNGICGELPLVTIVDKFEADYSYVTNEGRIFTFHTDKNAPYQRLINIDLDRPSEDNWVDLIPEDSKKVLDFAVCVDNDKLLVCYTEDVKNKLYLHDLKSGKLMKQYKLDVGSIAGLSGRKVYSEVFFKFVSFTTPGVIYHFDLKKSPEPKEFRRIAVPDFDGTQFETKQVFYESKDGTKVPMFIVHSKDFVYDGTAPCLMYGYGGFNCSELPHFSVVRTLFTKCFRGVFALLNLRGGGEYGEKWHEAGILERKQNVFDDCHAAAEYVIKAKYTSAKKLILQGGSNGGLLVAACINQRPELYGCGLAEVGVMDMLKYHKFTIGSHWKTDYGCSDNEKEFHYLLKYSPLHNVRVPSEDGVQYPPVLLLTGDHDDRVVPLHSLKLIAEMQYRLGSCPKQTNPLFIRIGVQTGHGGGKPTSKVIEQYIDMYCFVSKTLNLKFYD